MTAVETASHAAASAPRTPDEIRATYERAAGTWPEMLAATLELDPEFLDAFTRMAEIPARRSALSAKERALVGLAVDASTTRLFQPAVREHIRNALRFGATRDELVETLELACAIGIHTATVAMPILRESLEEHGEDVSGGALTAHETEVKEAFTTGRQGWTSLLEDFLRLDADWLEAYVDYSTVPWRRGALPPWFKELVYVAINVQTSHLYAPGTRFHMANALRQGATREQLLEVLEVVSLIGIHTMVMAAPILIAELNEAGSKSDVGTSPTAAW